MSEVSGPGVVDRLRAANSRLRELLAVRDAELAAVRAQKDAEIAQLRVALNAVLLRVAELERRVGSGSDDSGTPSSKEPIAAKTRRKAERKARRDTGTSSRERSADRSRGGQPGHEGRGLVRDPDPAHRETVAPPTACRGCGHDLDGADDAGMAWSQVWDVKVIPWRIEYLLPRRSCGCGATTTAVPAAGGPVNGISYGPGLNTAAVALTAFGNVCATRRSAISLAERGEMGGISLDLMANPEPKGNSGDNSMPENQRSRPGVWGGALGVRVTWRKLYCFKPNLQKAQRTAHRKDAW